jgi:hypothetical protein
MCRAPRSPTSLLSGVHHISIFNGELRGGRSGLAAINCNLELRYAPVVPAGPQAASWRWIQWLSVSARYEAPTVRDAGSNARQPARPEIHEHRKHDIFLEAPLQFDAQGQEIRTGTDAGADLRRPARMSVATRRIRGSNRQQSTLARSSWRRSVRFCAWLSDLLL